MEEFIIDLTELFKKHGVIVLKDSIELSSSPLHYDSISKLSSMDLVLKFTAIVEDNYLAEVYANEHGYIIIK